MWKEWRLIFDFHREGFAFQIFFWLALFLKGAFVSCLFPLFFYLKSLFSDRFFWRVFFPPARAICGFSWPAPFLGLFLVIFFSALFYTPFLFECAFFSLVKKKALFFRRLFCPLFLAPLISHSLFNNPRADDFSLFSK